MAFYGREREGGWNFVRACDLCVQGITAQTCICLCLLCCGQRGTWGAQPRLASGASSLFVPSPPPQPGWVHCKGHGGRGSAALAECRGLCEQRVQGSVPALERAPGRGSGVFPPGNGVFIAWNLWEGSGGRGGSAVPWAVVRLLLWMSPASLAGAVGILLENNLE